MALLSNTDTPTIVATLLGIAALGTAAERTPIGRWVPAPALILAGAVGLANLGILPRDAAAYKMVAGVAVPVGVFLLLLRADIRRIFWETGQLLRLYLIGALASLGGIVVALLVTPSLEAEKVAAVQLANLVGGTVNVIAVAHAVDLSGTAFTAMMTAAAVVMNGYLVLVSAAYGSETLRKVFGGRGSRNENSPERGEAAPAQGQARLTLHGLTWLGAGAALVAVVSDRLAGAIGRPELEIVFVTVAALAVANLGRGWVARFAGDREIGMLLMYLFFATLGVTVDLSRFGPDVARIVIFIVVAILVHLVVLLAIGRALGATLGEVIVASVAGVMGPSTAAAVAGSLREEALVSPGLLCGLLGFAIATFLGLGLYAVL